MVVPWCQVAGSPAAVPAKVAEVASNWSTTGLPLARTPQKLDGPNVPAAFPCGAARTKSSPRESVKAQRGGHTTASWCQQGLEPFQSTWL